MSIHETDRSSVAFEWFAFGAVKIFTRCHGAVITSSGLPYPEPHRLVDVHARSNNWDVTIFGEQRISGPDFTDIRRETRALDLAGVLFNEGTMSAPGEPEHVEQYEISSNMFSVLGLPMHRGRPFSVDEDREGGTPVMILGYSFWQRRFVGSDAALGSSVIFNGRRYTVVGVASALIPVDEEPDIYTPLAQNSQPFLKRRGPHPIGGIARLHAGMSVSQAQRELALIGRPSR